MSLTTLLHRFDWIRPNEQAKQCTCNHQLSGSNGIFFQSQGLLYCNGCKGFQLIRKPLT